MLLGIFTLIFCDPLTPIVLWVPVIYFAAFTFTLDMAFACSALSVFYRDVLYIVQPVIPVLFWLSPIFYHLAQVKLNLARLRIIRILLTQWSVLSMRFETGCSGAMHRTASLSALPS